MSSKNLPQDNLETAPLERLITPKLASLQPVPGLKNVTALHCLLKERWNFQVSLQDTDTSVLPN